MSLLQQVVRGPVAEPPRICIYGGHGIGKSSLGNGFPDPIFIDTEGGLKAIDVNARFPQAEDLDQAKQQIATLIKEDHPYKTVVLDTADWLVEPLITRVIDAKYDAKEQSYGKGQIYVAEEFRDMLQGFDKLRIKRNMNVVIIAHAVPQRYENPLTEPYDVFRPKLPTRCNALLKEWADLMAFATFQIVVKKADVGFNREVRRGVNTGERSLHLVETAAYVAKCRYPGAPDEVTMNKDPKATVADLAKYVPIVGLKQ